MPSPALVSLNSISEELLEMPSWGIADDPLNGKRERLEGSVARAEWPERQRIGSCAALVRLFWNTYSYPCADR